MNFLGNRKIIHMLRKYKLKKERNKKRKKKPIQLTLKMYFDNSEVML